MAGLMDQAREIGEQLLTFAQHAQEPLLPFKGRDLQVLWQR